jgi:hypothetical protein
MHLRHVQMDNYVAFILIHLHSLDCNIVDGEYDLIQEPEAQQEEAREPAPANPSPKNLPPHPQLKVSPGFMHNRLYMLFCCT